MKKKILKFIWISIFVFLSIIIYEITNVSFKTINRSIIEININNARNPQIKGFLRFCDSIYTALLLKFDNKTKTHFINEDNRNSLPKKKIIYKTSKFTKNLFPTLNNGKSWLRNYGNSASNRFSSLKLINKENIDKLGLAWEYEIKDDVFNDIQSNVIVADDRIFIPSFNKKLITLDARSGKLVWELTLDDQAPRRGMVYRKGEKNQSAKLYLPSYKKILAINTLDGSYVKNFGNNGKVKLRYPSITAPAIFENNLIITTSEPSLEVYDLDNGKLKWKFILMKKKFGRNGGKRYDYSGGNPWGGFSLDKLRGIAYITTGNAGRYFNGVNRPGKNKYANSIIAFDIKNKKKLWDFQEVRHDIWNLDIPAPPILGSITRNNKKIDVVIAVTKLGNTIVLDRLSGEPVYNINFKRAPISKLPGEKTNFYQPKIKIPEPFAKQEFNLDEVTNINQESRNFILNKIKDYNYGFFEPYEIGKKNIQYNFHGGAEWPGGSYNLNSGILYITSSNIAWEAEVVENKNNSVFKLPLYYKYNSKFKRLKAKNGYPGSKPPWGTITAINLNTGKIKWQIPFGEYKELTKKGIPITGTENYGGLTGTEAGLLLATGTLDKQFRILDVNNGKELWSYELPFIGSSPPVTYQIGNEQYILINATGSFSLKKGYPDLVNFGNKIMVFKLNNEK